MIKCSKCGGLGGNEGYIHVAHRIEELEAQVSFYMKENNEFEASIKEMKVKLNTAKAQGKADWNGANRRAMALADECGALKTQNTELLAENARLRRGAR